jgi:hypothetical protein
VQNLPESHLSIHKTPEAEAEPEAGDGDLNVEGGQETTEPQVASVTYCSNELFSLFKMMAA